MDYNSACARDISDLRDFCVYRGVFGDKPLNAANCIFRDLHPLPWQQNLGQYWL